MLSASEGRKGTAAKAAASTRLRSTEGRLTVERAPKQAHGAPARPRISAEPIIAANISISAAAPNAAPSSPAATPTASASSVAISPAQAAARSGPSLKPKVASAALLVAGEASFASAAPASTPASAIRTTISIILRSASYHRVSRRKGLLLVQGVRWPSAQTAC